MRFQVLLAPICLFLVSEITLAAGTGPQLESIEGAKSVKVVGADDKERASVEGDDLNPGDRVETGPKITVRIAYPDGSLIVVGPESRIEIQNVEHGTQWNRVARGTLRALVPKSAKPADASGNRSTPRKYRFGTHAPGLVMGVRGTDYQVQVLGEKVTLTVFSGVVEAARTEAELTTASREVTSVQESQRLEATAKDLVLTRKAMTNEALRSADVELHQLLHRKMKHFSHEQAPEATAPPQADPKAHPGYPNPHASP